MFEPSDTPRIFAQDPGVDFPRTVVEGLRARMAGAPPEAMARVTVFVNTTRMRRRMLDLFDEGSAGLLPRIRLVTELGQDAAMADLPPAISPLRRRLELSTLIAKLLEQDPSLAPRASIYPLADSLANLMDEMQGEGVSPQKLHELDVSHHSEHWSRSLAFVQLVEQFFGDKNGVEPDLEARQRRVIERLVTLWQKEPPEDPIIVAGSTGSRGATRLFMEMVAKLPQGAVILPGFDFDLPQAVWDKMKIPLTASDHPQYRYRSLMQSLEIDRTRIALWHDTAPPAPRRNAFVSLALRPAPVTDQWQAEAPAFMGIEEATEALTLIEAPSRRAEASAIALIIRQAAEAGREAALITPDRNLTRQVTAALDRWGIIPDDSAGRPLPLSAPGRLLRHVAQLRGQKVTSVDLLTLLKHPLVHSGEARNEHLRLTRDLELTALRGAMPYPNAEELVAWAGEQEDRLAWCHWIGELLGGLKADGDTALMDHVKQTISVTEQLCGGSRSAGSGGLWDREPGREALRIVAELEREAPHGGDMNATEFRDLFEAVLNRGEVRDINEPHPTIKIWGTLEARVQGVDLAILAGLNDGVWPESPGADPWMNRDMRHQAGLLLPDRQIGLSAHDFQQAIGIGSVVLTRSLRDDEAETVPSRWINRITNLMDGMSDAGKTSLEAMRDRGRDWLLQAALLDAPKEREHKRPLELRPSPHPPVDAQPKKLSFTDVKHLIRDPYAIYAKRVLRLRPLDPLHQSPDAAQRGTAIHEVMERFVADRGDGETIDVQQERLLQIAREVFEEQAPWPAARLVWLAKFERALDVFLEDEAVRRSEASETLTERDGSAEFGSPKVTLYGRADRIDRLNTGYLAIYDYKTGQLPTPKQQNAFDKQLLLEALVARYGGFEGVAQAETAKVAYIGLGASSKTAPVEITSDRLDDIETEFVSILAGFASGERGYTARRVVFRSESHEGAYDHLSRFGEWDHGDEPNAREVGR
ncbi:MAG TPA: double-strand break repair protein AddB [Maritimibacter sp.]|nr:double-strand break repair protein AddB [Maritimibacter sp.]